MIVVGKHVISRARRMHLRGTEFRSRLLKDRREGRGVAGNSAEMYTQVCAHSISRFRETRSLMTLGR